MELDTIHLFTIQPLCDDNEWIGPMNSLICQVGMQQIGIALLKYAVMGHRNHDSGTANKSSC